MVKYCFTTALFSDKMLDKPGKFKTIPGIDYYLFTNLEKANFDTSWNIINVQHFDGYNNIQMSRYFKFLGWKHLRDKNYDVIFWCDATLNPICNVDWNSLAIKILKSNGLQFLQQLHKNGRGINRELETIVKDKKDTKVNISKTSLYLKKNFPGISYTQRIYINRIFGYSPKSPLTVDILTKFWEYYLKSPTYRDQPLWAAICFSSSVSPIIYNIENHFRKSGVAMKHNIINY